MTGKTILITGAPGFTGKHLIQAAKALGYRCVALALDNNINSDADETQIANILDPIALGQAVKQVNPEYIVHLAAVSFVAHDNISEIYQVNQLGTINLLEAARKHAPNIEKILIASSANIYGNARKLPITESTPIEPVNHYGMSKYTMELATRLYSDLPIVITRPFNYTGPGQDLNFLVPKIVNAFKSGSKVIELGNLDVSRDFSDVRDVATAYLRLLETSTGETVFNICSGIPTSLLSIVNSLNSLAGYEIKVIVNPEFVREDEIKTLYGSPEKIEAAIGDYRQHSINDTLAVMLRS